MTSRRSGRSAGPADRVRAAARASGLRPGLGARRGGAAVASAGGPGGGACVRGCRLGAGAAGPGPAGPAFAGIRPHHGRRPRGAAGRAARPRGAIMVDAPYGVPTPPATAWTVLGAGPLASESRDAFPRAFALDDSRYVFSDLRRPPRARRPAPDGGAVCRCRATSRAGRWSRVATGSTPSAVRGRGPPTRGSRRTSAPPGTACRIERRCRAARAHRPAAGPAQGTHHRECGADGVCDGADCGRSSSGSVEFFPGRSWSW